MIQDYSPDLQDLYHIQMSREGVKTIDMDYLPEDIDDYTIIRVKGVRYYPEFLCTRKPSTRYIPESEYWYET